jgi:hypothetical protein
MAIRLPELERPAVLQGSLSEWSELLAARGEERVRFDAIIGRAAFTPPRGTEGRTPALDRPAAASLLVGLLAPGGAISLAEPVPRRAQRLYALVDLAPLGKSLAGKVRDAEEAIYAAPGDPWVNWNADDLRTCFLAAGVADVAVETRETTAETRIAPPMLARWFTSAPEGQRPSYSQHLAARLDPEELGRVQGLYEHSLSGQMVPWRSVTAYLVARLAMP